MWTPKCKPITSSGAQLSNSNLFYPGRTIGCIKLSMKKKRGNSTQNRYTIFYGWFGVFFMDKFDHGCYSSFLSTVSKSKKSLKNSILEEPIWQQIPWGYLWSSVSQSVWLRDAAPDPAGGVTKENSHSFSPYENSDFQNTCDRTGLQDRLRTSIWFSTHLLLFTMMPE